MPLQFNVGEITERLRRALGTRGKTSYGLDETVVPVSLVMDASRAPYRRDERRWFMRPLSPAVAAQNSRVFLNNPTNQDMVIDWVTLALTGGAFTVFYGTGAGSLGVLTGFSTEGVTPQQVAAGTFSTPRGPGLLVAAGAGSVIVNLFGEINATAAAAGAVQLFLDLVLPAGCTIIFEGTVVNTPLQMTISGRTFDNAGR